MYSVLGFDDWQPQNTVLANFNSDMFLIGLTPSDVSTCRVAEAESFLSGKLRCSTAREGWLFN